jgi:hypothetical protein
MTTYTDTTVGIDDYYPALPAKVLDGRRWNGWAIPFFTLDTVRVLAELLERDRQDDDDPYVVIDGVDGGMVRLVQPRARGDYADYEEMLEGETVKPVMIDGVAHYSVGGMDWCWHEVDETEED